METIKSQFVRLAGSPRVLRWGAPWRMLRQSSSGRSRPVPPCEARSILVIRPDEIGDVVLTVPFLRALRGAAPQAMITLLVKPACRELVQNCPYVDSVHTLDFAPRWDKPGYRLRLCREALTLRKAKIGRNGFDLVLLPRCEPDAYDSILTGHLLAGEGTIMVHRTERQSAAGAMPPAPPLKFETRLNPVVEHEVPHSLRFLESCGVGGPKDDRLELWPDDRDRKFAASVLEAGKSYVAMATGAGNPSRCWPVGRFAAIAGWLRTEHGLHSVLLGAQGDPRFAAEVDLLGKTSLREAAAVMARCGVFVGNDSGLMHIAAAVGAPVVEISGFRQGAEPGHPNSPVRFHAWGVPNRILQPPPGEGLLRIDEVGESPVRLACVELLARSKRPVEN